MNTLQQVIDEMKAEFSMAMECAESWKEVDGRVYNDFYNEAKAIEKWIPKLESVLSDKDTEAITETAHCANTMLSESADNKDGQVIGDVGADSSETEIVKQNEQTKELCQCVSYPLKDDWDNNECSACDMPYH